MDNNYFQELENLSADEFSSLIFAQGDNWKNTLDFLLYFWKINSDLTYELRVKLLPQFNETYNKSDLTNTDKYLLELVFLKILKCDLELSSINFDSYNKNSLYSYSRIALIDSDFASKVKFISDLRCELIFNLNQMNLGNSLKNLIILFNDNEISNQQKQTYLQALKHIETYNENVLSGELSGEIFLLSTVL